MPVAGSPGFLVNRVLFPYMLEAATAYAEGIPGPVIDKAAVKFGMPMGPIELIDTVGWTWRAWGANWRRSSACRFRRLQTVEQDKRGKKDGQGIYTWENGKPKKPDVASDYQAPADLEDRLILPLLNEAVACLHEGVVADADLLDAGVIFGTGFAPFRGDPAHPCGGCRCDRRAVEGAAAAPRRPLRPAPGLDNPAPARTGGLSLYRPAARHPQRQPPKPEPEQQSALAFLFVGRGGVGLRGRRKPVPEVTRELDARSNPEGYMNRYDARFKLQVAKEACKTSTSVKAVARRHSLEASTVRRWVATYRLHGWRGFHRQARFYDLPFKLAVLEK